MTILSIREAYQAEILRGSWLTLLLSSHHSYFQETINAHHGGYKTALKVAYFVSAVVVYPLFGIVALIGIGRNLFQIREVRKETDRLLRRISYKFHVFKDRWCGAFATYPFESHSSEAHLYTGNATSTWIVTNVTADTPFPETVSEAIRSWTQVGIPRSYSMRWNAKGGDGPQEQMTITVTISNILATSRSAMDEKSCLESTPTTNFCK